MEVFEKQLLIMAGSAALGLILVFSGITTLLHEFAVDTTRPFMERYARENASSLEHSVGYTFELLLAVLLMLTPLSAAGGVWLFKIAFELTLGKSAAVNAFVVSQSLNWVMALFCIALFFYSIYEQYNWSIKLTQPLPKKLDNKDLSRLI
jgi:hypothetical protein